MDNFLFSNNSCRIMIRSVILLFSLNSVSVFAQATLSDTLSNINSNHASLKKSNDAMEETNTETSFSKVTAPARGFAIPGEAIRIYTIPDTSAFVNGFYPVDGEGRIFLPIIGKMNISSMTEKAFIDTLKAVYINYLRYPNIQIRHLVRVSLLGGFQRPGLYYIDPDYSIWDAVYLTGGTIREDGLTRMRWERSHKIVAKDLLPYYQSGKSLQTIGFKSGDQLWTPSEPKRNWWDIAVKDVVLSQIFPIVATSASLYVSYMMYKSYKTR